MKLLNLTSPLRVLLATSREVRHVRLNFELTFRCRKFRLIDYFVDPARLTRADSSVRIRTREEFKELLKESSSDLKQAVLPTSPKKNRRRVSFLNLK